jgi:hypothetical protein
MAFAKLLSGRVAKVSGSNLSSDRYEYIKVSESEPDFGHPSFDNGIFSSRLSGERRFLFPSTGLVVDNVTGNITVDFSQSGNEGFVTVEVVDTDSGYTWAETGTVVADNNTGNLQFVSGTYINIDADTTNDAVRITHIDTTRTDTTSTSSPSYGGTIDVVTSVTSNTQGHVTAINVETITLPSSDDTTYTISTEPGLDGVSEIIRLSGSDGSTDDVTLAVSQVDSTNGLTISEAGDTITFAHADTSSQPSVDNSGNNFIQDVTLDTYGHITGLVSSAIDFNVSDNFAFSNITVSDTDSGYTWVETGTVSAVNNTDTVTFVSGTQIDIDADTENNAIRISHADTSLLNGTYGNDGIANITVDENGHVTELTTATFISSESNDFGIVAVTDTDSGYTWAATGNAVADSQGDVITFVSGASIDIDIDPTNDAIRVTYTGSSTDIYQDIALDSTDAAQYITFVPNTTGGQTGRVDTDLTYNPSSNLLSVGGDLVVGGDLTVNGTTTTVNSTTVTIDDPIFTLGGDTAPTLDDNKDRGIEFRWHDGAAAKVGFFGFDDSTGKFTFIPDATNTSEVFSGTTGEIDAKVDWSNLLNIPSGGGSDTTGINIVAASDSAIVDGAATNGNVWLNHIENNTVVSNHNIIGSGGITVVSDANGDITINGAGTSNTTYSISAETGVGGTNLRLTDSSAVTDDVLFANGTYITTTRTDADTITITHNDTTRTDTTSTDTPTYGGNFDVVDSVTTNTQGHVTAINVKTVTIPSSDNTDTLQDIALDATDAAQYISFVPNTSGAQTGRVDGDLTYNPSTNLLTTENVSVTGELSVGSVYNLGTTPPAVSIVYSSAGRTYDIDASTEFFVERATTSYMSLIGNSSTVINFGDSTSEFNGRIVYIPTDHSLYFETDSTERLRITGAGNVLINTTTDNGVDKLQVSGSANISTDLTVGGNLTVSGTTTTVNSTVVTIDDPVFTLGGDTAPTSDDNKDRGIEFRWHDGVAPKVGFFGFDDSTGKWTFIPDATNTSEVFSGTTGELDAKVDWSNLLNVPSGGGSDTTYSISAESPSGNTVLRLTGSDATTDDVEFVGAGGTTVTRTDADTITISSTSTANSFETVTVTDTDSGYTWSETGNVVADSTTDTLTFVSGTDINIDVDPTNDAIRVSYTGVATDTLQDIALDATDAAQYITFVPNTSGGQTGRVDGDLTYNPSSNVLTAENLTVDGGSVSYISPDGLNTITTSVDDSDVWSITGDSGVLFSVDDAPGGTLIVYDGSSNVVIEVDANGDVLLNETTGSVLIGTGTDNGVDKLQVVGSTNITGDLNLGSNIVFEGATADAFETTLTVTDPTQDNTITFQDGTGTVAFLSDVAAVTETDTLDSVTTRGNTTVNTINVGGLTIDTNTVFLSKSTTIATTAQTPFNIYSSTTYAAAKILIQANDTVSGERQMSELLVIHDGSTAKATEYGIIFTGASALATYDVDVSGGNVRLLITGASANSTEYKITEILSLL